MSDLCPTVSPPWRRGGRSGVCFAVAATPKLSQRIVTINQLKQSSNCSDVESDSAERKLLRIDWKRCA